MNTLATILANLGELADPALGVQSFGACVLLYTLRKIDGISSDVADIKARLGLIEDHQENQSRK